MTEELKTLDYSLSKQQYAAAFEDLRTFLIRIRSMLETETTSTEIYKQADAALCLLDSYHLGLQTSTKQMRLPLETMSLGGLVKRSEQHIIPILRAANMEIEVVCSRKSVLVSVCPVVFTRAILLCAQILSPIDKSDLGGLIKMTARATKKASSISIYRPTKNRQRWSQLVKEGSFGSDFLPFSNQSGVGFRVNLLLSKQLELV
jgi:hypothetical protein